MQTTERNVEIADLEERAQAYFAAQGIDPKVAPEGLSLPEETPRELVTLSLETHQCMIKLVSVVFYTYCTIDVPSIGASFEGHAGGLGVGTIGAVGAIYYSSLADLLATRDFGVFFTADSGGAVHVTWGSHGNATAVGVGAGAGAMGGRGTWRKH